MRYQLLSVFFGIAFIGTGFTQTTVEKDSLAKRLIHLSNDTNRVNTLCNFAFQFQRTKPDTTCLLAQQAYALSHSLKYPMGEARALNVLAIGLNQLGDYPKALKVYNQVRELFIALKNKQGETITQNNVASLYMEQGDWQKGLETMHDCYRLYETQTNPRASSKPIYFSNIGECFYNLNQLDSALYYLNQALPLAIAQNNAVLGDILYILGDVASAQNDTEKAIYYFQESIKYSLQNSDYISLNKAYLRMSKLYQKMAKPDSAIHYAKRALLFSQKGPYLQGELKSSQYLATLYKGKDNTEALNYYEVAAAAKDSLYSQDKVKQMLSISFEEKQHAQEIEATNIANTAKIRNYTLLGILSVIGAIAIVLFRNNRQKQKANLKLQKQKEEIDEKSQQLEKSLETLNATQNQLVQSAKLASLGELTGGIAHEIQNPLNFVSNFSELSLDLTNDITKEIHKEEIDTAYLEELLTYLKFNQEKINHHSKRASNIVKGMLEHSRASIGVKELTNINVLAFEYFRLSYQGMLNKDKHFNSEMVSLFDEDLPKINIIQQELGRAILNLINNAFYAVNARRKDALHASHNTHETLHATSRQQKYQPTVTVQTQCLRLNNVNTIEIRIKDNGMGIPESIREKIFQPFFSTKPSGQGTGLGLSLAYDIVTKGYGGTLTLQSTEGVGSEFIISLPF